MTVKLATRIKAQGALVSANATVGAPVVEVVRWNFQQAPEEVYNLNITAQPGSSVVLPSDLYTVPPGRTAVWSLPDQTDGTTIAANTPTVTIGPEVPATAQYIIDVDLQDLESPDAFFEPNIIGEPQPEWWRSVDSVTTSLGGITRAAWHARLGLVWENPNTGDWTDANGVSQGTQAFHTAAIGAANLYHPIVVTGVVARALASGINKGVHLVLSGSNGPSINFQGRLAANPPTLSVVTSAGTFPCPCIFLGRIDPSTANPLSGLTTGSISTTRRVVLQFDLSSVTGTLISATAQLYVTAVFGSNRVAHVFENRPPQYMAGAGNETPVLGLAAQVGEASLSSHPDVYAAGDFAGTTFYSQSGNVYANIPKLGITRVPFVNTVQILPDPEAPGTSYWRGEVVNVVPGGANRSLCKIRKSFILPSFGDPLYPVNPATVLDRLYVRMYFMLESDYLDRSEGTKMGLSFDTQLGFWVPNAEYPDGGYWEPEGGNSSLYGDGMAHLGDCHDTDGTVYPIGWYEHVDRNQWSYKGQANWGQSLYVGQPGEPNWDLKSLRNYSYSIDMPNGVFIDGQWNHGNVIRPTIRLGRYYCLEQYIQLNTVQDGQDGRPYTPLLDKNGNSYGNYEANYDGVLKTWLNGVLVDERSPAYNNAIRWRRNNLIGIRAAGTEWYFGGNDFSSLPSPAHFRLNHMVVARRYIGPRVRP